MKFQSRCRDSFQIKHIWFLKIFEGYRVSIPLPGFVSNQVPGDSCPRYPPIPFQSRCRDSFQIKQLEEFNKGVEDLGFNPVAGIRFKSS